MPLLKRRNPTIMTNAEPSGPLAELPLAAGVPLLIYPPQERRKHLALIGDTAWVDYWLMDLLAHSKQSGIKSALITGPADAGLRALPAALDLPADLCDVRSIIEPGTDPSTLRKRVTAFLKTVDDTAPTLIFMGHNLGHAWPFLLGRQPETHQKNLLIIANMSQQLKLPLAEHCRYFLVQDTYEDQFMSAVERWHRHDPVKPNYKPTYLHKERGVLFEH